MRPSGPGCWIGCAARRSESGVSTSTRERRPVVRDPKLDAYGAQLAAALPSLRIRRLTATGGFPEARALAAAVR